LSDPALFVSPGTPSGPWGAEPAQFDRSGLGLLMLSGRKIRERVYWHFPLSFIGSHLTEVTDPGEPIKRDERRRQCTLSRQSGGWRQGFVLA
jgi:hypothetical protein